MEKINLQKIISVSGKPGLYKVSGSGKSAVVAESLLDGKKQPIHNSQKVSSLGDISMFTDEEDVPLRKVLENMREMFQAGPAPEGKAETKVLRDAMDKILPGYDRERVYDSDLRKLFTWYNLLQKNNMLEFEEDKEEEDVVEASAEKTAE
ncbi:MAG: DUF5606 domain-containing protein [Flavobacteriales bacterium]|nr:DUF5606 domain-containing protein [Flavobacteriales bacterium]